jgi:hypothetical protein
LTFNVHEACSKLVLGDVGSAAKLLLLQSEVGLLSSAKLFEVLASSLSSELLLLSILVSGSLIKLV